MRHDLDKASDALNAISPDLPRDSWVQVGMAAKAAGLAFEDFDSWSAAGSTYKARDARDTWASIRDGKGIGAGTLFKHARDAGWKPERQQKHAFPPTQQAQAARKVAKPSAKVLELWNRCKPATESHPYILAKQGRAEGLRVVPQGDPQRVSGQSVEGWLVVPVLPLGNSEPVSLVFIPPPGTGKKLNLPGAPMAGVFTVGDAATSDVVYVVEGIGHAWSCWKATGCAAVVCFGSPNMRRAAEELRKQNASAAVVVVADAGKEREVESIAAKVGTRFVTMPQGWPANSDVNDLAQRDGLEALKDLLSRARLPDHRFRLLGSEDLQALPPLEWCIRGVLPAQGLASVYGPSACGKSFLVLDAAVAIADGAQWFGYRVKARPVVYCALEGEAGFRLRVVAWEQARGRKIPVNLRMVLQPFRLIEADDVHDMAQAVLTLGTGAVVILDTLNRAAPEADENASSDMGQILEAAKTLQALTQGLVVLVHHTGKDANRGMRGHSSLFAALDAAIEVTRDGTRREWRVSKAKDGQDGALHAFRLETVDLGEDSDGEPVTSCAVEPDELPEEATRRKLPKGGNQKVVWDALGELLRQSTHWGKAGAPPVRPCVELEATVDAIAPRLAVEPKRQKERVRQAITGLHGSGLITLREGWIWVA